MLLSFTRWAWLRLDNAFTAMDIPGPFSTASQLCELCGKAVAVHAQIDLKDKGYLHCTSHRCMNVVKQKDYLDPKRYAYHLEMHRRDLQQVQNLSNRRIEQEQAVDIQEKCEREIVIEQTLLSNPNLSNESLAVVSIPSGPSESTLLTHERIAAYQKNLKLAIAEAEAEAVKSVFSPSTAPEHNHESSAENSDLAETMCGLCKGGCCTLGADKAYISAITLQRRMQENPNLSSDEILDRYMSYLPANSISNSCINHTETGCALPCNWRSDVCNSFLCPELKQYAEAIEYTGNPTRLVVVQRDYTHWNRYALDLDVQVSSIRTFTGDLVETDSIPVSLLKQ